MIKDAGDDPDVTNGAEIIAVISRNTAGEGEGSVEIKAGFGVGTVTKPGLSIPVGEPAINPVPRQMIREAVAEAITEVIDPRLNRCVLLLRSLCATVKNWQKKP